MIFPVCFSTISWSTRKQHEPSFQNWFLDSWLRHQMETFSAFLALCEGNSIHRSPMNSPNKGQWRRSLMFSLICAWTNCWVNNCDAGDLRRHRAHYELTVMILFLVTHVVRMGSRNDFPTRGYTPDAEPMSTDIECQTVICTELPVILISVGQLQAVTWLIWEVWGQITIWCPFMCAKLICSNLL